MRLLRFVFTLLLIIYTMSMHYAQGNNNGNIEPVQSCSPITSLCISSMTPAPTISVASDLPDLEYIVVDQSVMATNGSGPAIVGIDDDGIFLPTAFGVMPGNTIEVIPIAFNLADIQETVDDLLKGTFIFQCCFFVGTVCTDLNNAGIFCGADVTSLADVAVLFDPGTDLLSISDLTTGLSDANMQLQDPGTPEPCGGGDFIAYAYGNSCNFTIIDAIAIINSPDHTIGETITRSDFVESGALVSSPLIVEYFGGNYVELVSPFEVQIGGEFLADILVCP